MRQHRKKMIEIEAARLFINLISTFEHQYFFLYNEWKNIPGFQETDRTQIIIAFLHYWFHNKTGYFTCPIGMSWFEECDEESYNIYISQYMPVIDAYEDWKIFQR
jgi:hypothetical protein